MISGDHKKNLGDMPAGGRRLAPRALPQEAQDGLGSIQRNHQAAQIGHLGDWHARRDQGAGGPATMALPEIDGGLAQRLDRRQRGLVVHIDSSPRQVGKRIVEHGSGKPPGKHAQIDLEAVGEAFQRQDIFTRLPGPDELLGRPALDRLRGLVPQAPEASDKLRWVARRGPRCKPDQECVQDCARHIVRRHRLARAVSGKGDQERALTAVEPAFQGTPGGREWRVGCIDCSQAEEDEVQVRHDVVEAFPADAKRLR